ncbi:DUF7706 family protein [Noviherbaspirillum saxi]|uniref:Uncharacterized protein n=1 Tax=Noviherbaspirillum saxi TaxID=2320863 RepID=A0A3A3FFX6_9BURK|nr:hypothetical protein [Noviherbaspirillum saxi]RJF91951.1 hypothetical protein D3871_25120 [Noviherbaspirillum saxi]RJF91960.1 hypothetical protein D3871_25175 [Noviherbaspirillum saxi]RJF91977.1 hypothetical protein D3871_25275 [Noviherbaspirillum saxi]RJF91984.1 hypothetical protein D3871_25310 [Noviherbaspirillum saxi]
MLIEVNLPDELAWALAEFLKRAGYSDYRQLAVSEQEAYDMQDAGEKVRAALAERGIAPR